MFRYDPTYQAEIEFQNNGAARVAGINAIVSGTILCVVLLFMLWLRVPPEWLVPVTISVATVLLIFFIGEVIGVIAARQAIQLHAMLSNKERNGVQVP